MRACRRTTPGDVKEGHNKGQIRLKESATKNKQRIVSNRKALRYDNLRIESGCEVWTTLNDFWLDKSPFKRQKKE